MSTLIPVKVTLSKVKIAQVKEIEGYLYNISNAPYTLKTLKYNENTAAVFDAFAKYPELRSPFFLSCFPGSLIEATEDINKKFKDNAKDGKAIVMTVGNARKKFTRATHEYREAMIAGKLYLYRDHLSHTNSSIFKDNFALFDPSRVRATKEYKYEDDQEEITFEDYMIQTNVLRAELGLAPCRSPVDHPVIDQAVDDQPVVNFLSMEEAMEMEFSPESSQIDPEIIETAADSETNNNVQIMEFAGQLNEEDALFLDQYLKLNEVTKKEARNVVAALCNPAVVVQKIPKY